MVINFSCPGCGKALRVKDELAGKKGKCPGCGDMLLVPEPGPAAEPAQPRPDAEAAGEVKRRVSPRALALGGAGVLVVVAALAVVLAVSGGAPKAATPKDALKHFVMAMDKGDVSGMMATAHYTDKVAVEATCALAAKMRELQKALDNEYGKQQGELKMTLGGWGALTLEKIESKDCRITEEGGIATARMGASGKKIPLIRKNGFWYADMTADAPKGQRREQVLGMVKGISKALKVAQGKIGKKGMTRDQILKGFMGSLMASAVKQMQQAWKKASETPIPPEQEKAIRAAVRKFGEVVAAPNVAALKAILPRPQKHVTRPSEMALRHCTEAYFKHLKTLGLSFKIEEIKKVSPTALWPEYAAVRVVVAASSPNGTQHEEAWLCFMNQDGDWRLSEVRSTLLFPRKPVLKIPTDQFSQYIAMYPGVKFSAGTSQIGFGHLKKVSRRDLTGIKGTTSDDFMRICEFYRKELQENWRDYVERSSSRGRIRRKCYLQASATRRLADGKLIGVTVQARQPPMKKTTDLEIRILMGYLPAGAQVSEPGPRRVSPKGKPSQPVPGASKRGPRPRGGRGRHFQ